MNEIESKKNEFNILKDNVNRLEIKIIEHKWTDICISCVIGHEANMFWSYYAHNT